MEKTRKGGRGGGNTRGKTEGGDREDQKGWEGEGRKGIKEEDKVVEEERGKEGKKQGLGGRKEKEKKKKRRRNHTKKKGTGVGRELARRKKTESVLVSLWVDGGWEWSVSDCHHHGTNHFLKKIGPQNFTVVTVLIHSKTKDL